jgi:hypothetical protein
MLDWTDQLTIKQVFSANVKSIIIQAPHSNIDVSSEAIAIKLFYFITN